MLGGSYFFLHFAPFRHYAALQALALSEEDITWDPEKNDNTRLVHYSAAVTAAAFERWCLQYCHAKGQTLRTTIP